MQACLRSRWLIQCTYMLRSCIRLLHVAEQPSVRQ